MSNEGDKKLFEDDDDIFKSAVESPMTDSEKTIHGDDEIDLNDDDEDIVESLKSAIAVDAEVKVNDSNRHNNYDSSPHDPFGSSSLTNKVNETDKSEEKKDQVNKQYQHNQQGQSVLQPTTTMSHSDIAEDNCQFIEITITEPQKQGEGMSGFIVYRVTTRTNIALFRRKEFAVWRRFSDFLGLHCKLAEKYLKKGRIVPPAPEKNVIGTTKIKISGQGESNTNHSEFLERRRSELERFVNRIASHTTLRIDPDFRDFLEIDSDLPKATSTSAFSGAGMARLFSRFGETVNKISYKMDDSHDSWFEEKIQNIEALENQLRKVHSSLELLVSNRKELAHSTGSFAKSAAILSNAEESTALARALAQLAEIEEKVEQVHHEQANSDYFLFAELLKDYIALIGSIKEVFHERVKAYQSWQHAQQMLNKKREMKAKMELAVKNDKVAQCREEVVMWEGKVETCQEEFNSISAVIKKELEQFEVSRVKEFKKIIVRYLETLLKQQQELVKYWENFLPEAKAIA